MTAYERYKKLMLERPEEFKPSEKGLLRIVTDPEIIKQYEGKTGEVTHIDDIGQLHGTWGGLAVIPDADSFEIVE